MFAGEYLKLKGEILKLLLKFKLRPTIFG